MGMNIITIDILPQEIQYLYNDGTWKYEGVSNISCKLALTLVKELKFKKIGKNFYTDNKSIDIRILERDNKLVAICVEGLVGCFDKVLESCYNLAQYFSSSFKPKFCVLGDIIEYGQYDKYLITVSELYQEKIKWYKNGHLREFMYIIPPHKFDKVYKHYLKKYRLL